MANNKLFTEEWRAKHADLYSKATTQHPYITSIHTGSVDLNSYKRWLGQDYIFVKAFVRFISSLLLKLPKETNDQVLMTLLGGAAALHDELTWFQAQASLWSIDLNNLSPKRAAQLYIRYCTSTCTKDFLPPPQLPRGDEPTDVDFPVALATFWTIEVVYSDSFAYCLQPDAKPPPELTEACMRWGSPSFRSYCQALKTLVDSFMKASAAKTVADSEKAFVRVLELEVEFWNMSSDSS